ncbi:MAG TPA: hypothetical protein VF782_06735 [Allosphingosinicella sp.]|jgi:hypothetical protein
MKIKLIVDEEVVTLAGAERCLAVLKADARRPVARRLAIYPPALFTIETCQRWLTFITSDSIPSPSYGREKMDLFEAAEKLLRGLVYFVYNFFFSLAALMSPYRGPIALERRYTKAGTRQIGGMTILFLVQLIPLSLLLPAVFSTGALARISEKFATGVATGSFTWNDFWPSAIAAIFTTVAIDCGLRLWLSLFGISRQELRDRLVTRIEYALVLPVLVTLLFLPAVLLVVPLALVDGLLFQLTCTIAYLLIAVLGCRPAMRFLRSAILRHGRTRRLSSLRIPNSSRSREDVRASSTLFLAVLIAFAPLGGLLVGVAIQTRRDQIEVQAQDLNVVHAMCRVGKGEITLEPMLWNAGSRPIVLDRKEFVLALGRASEAEATGFSPSARLSYFSFVRAPLREPPVVIGPGQIRNAGTWRLRDKGFNPSTAYSCQLLSERIGYAQPVFPLLATDGSRGTGGKW